MRLNTETRVRLCRELFWESLGYLLYVGPVTAAGSAGAPSRSRLGLELVNFRLVYSFKEPFVIYNHYMYIHLHVWVFLVDFQREEWRSLFAVQELIVLYWVVQSCSGVVVLFRNRDMEKKEEKSTVDGWWLCAEGGRCLNRREDGGIHPPFNHSCCLLLVFSPACFDGPVFRSLSIFFFLPSGTYVYNILSWREGREINVFLVLSQWKGDKGRGQEERGIRRSTNVVLLEEPLYTMVHLLDTQTQTHKY